MYYHYIFEDIRRSCFSSSVLASLESIMFILPIETNGMPVIPKKHSIILL